MEFNDYLIIINETIIIIIIILLTNQLMWKDIELSKIYY
jgi:hypothetical protein